MPPCQSTQEPVHIPCSAHYLDEHRINDKLDSKESLTCTLETSFLFPSPLERHLANNLRIQHPLGPKNKAGEASWKTLREDSVHGPDGMLCHLHS